LTLQDLRDHFARQVLVFEAYFNTDDTDAKTAKAYRKNIKEAQDRLDVVEKILLDGYVPVEHAAPVDNDKPGDEIL
jgi:hypothetical protein